MLKREGYIWDWEEVAAKPANQLRVHLKYGPNGERVIRRIRRVSKPGRRVYSGAADLKPVLGGLGISHHQHQPRRDQRPRGPAAKAGRRSALRNLVDPLQRTARVEAIKAITMSRIGKKPVLVPDRREGRRSPSATITRGRPVGKLQWEHRPEVTVAYDEAAKSAHRHPPRRRAAEPRPARA